MGARTSLGGAERGLTFCSQRSLRAPLQCARTRKLLHCFNDITAFPDIVRVTNSYHFYFKRPQNPDSHLYRSYLSQAARTRSITQTILLMFSPRHLSNTPFSVFRHFLYFRANAPILPVSCCFSLLNFSADHSFTYIIVLQSQ